MTVAHLSPPQVPESCFDVISSDAGASVIYAPKSFSSQRSIPDLDEFLTELNNANLEYNAGFMSLDDAIYFDMDTKMYEESCGITKPVKMEPKETEAASCAPAAQPLPEDTLLKQEREKIHYACAALDLPDSEYFYDQLSVNMLVLSKYRRTPDNSYTCDVHLPI